MKSLNTSLTTKDNTVSSLASHFMDMFDTSKLETSLLKKRDFQSQDNLFQTELQKKLKTSAMTPSDLLMSASLQNSAFSSLLSNRSYPVNPLLSLLTQNNTYGALADQLKTVQNLTLLRQQQDALLSLQPLSFPTQLGLNTLQSKFLTVKDSQVKAGKTNVKEEYVKQEEHANTQNSPAMKFTISDKHTTDVSENSPVSTELEMSDAVGTPALVEFTKEFPEWDLATIFGYIKSGKSREVFEKEKQFKVERKLRRQKNKLANKEKAGAGLKQKKVKGKKMEI